MISWQICVANGLRSVWWKFDASELLLQGILGLYKCVPSLNLLPGSKYCNPFYIDTFPKQLKYERLFYWELNKYQILDFNKKNNILILTSQMDWPRKTTPNWHITYQNPYSGSKVIICKAHIHLPLKMVLPSMISIISSVVLAQILSSSLSLRSWPRHFKIHNIILKAPFSGEEPTLG